MPDSALPEQRRLRQQSLEIRGDLHLVSTCLPHYGLPHLRVFRLPFGSIRLSFYDVSDLLNFPANAHVISRDAVHANITMRLIRTVEVPETPRDQIFRASRMRAILFILVCLAGCAAMIVYHWPRPRLAYYLSASVILLLIAGRQFVIARFHPSNWLVRIGDEGLFIHFRSYLNERLSAEDPTVVFLAYSDIRSVRLVQERVKTRDMEGATVSEIRRCVEFELAVDTSPLVAALAVESARPGVKEKRWYGSSSTLYRDYPVQMQSPPFLRVGWQVVPRASKFLDLLRPRVEIGEPVVVSEDFANLHELPRDQQQKRLHELDQRGQTTAAVYMARKLYALNLTEATKFVKDLREGAQL